MTLRNKPGLTIAALAESLIAGTLRRPGPGHLVAALMLALGAVLMRLLLQKTAPGIGYFGVLVPVVMFTSVFLGTLPAILSAAAAAGVTTLLFLQPDIWLPPLFNPAQRAVVFFGLVCAAAIWTGRIVRAVVLDARDAEARLAEVFRQIPGAAAILAAPDARLVLRSTQSAAVMGQPEHPVHTADAATHHGGLHPDGRIYDASEYPVVRALRTGETIGGERMRYRKPDGTIVDLEIHAGPVRAGDGRIVASVDMAFDVTERMNAERRLLESEAACRATSIRLRAAIDAGRMGTWELDIVTGGLHLDAVMADMVGLGAEPVSDDRAAFAQLIAADDRPRMRSALLEAISSGTAYADEHRVLLPAGGTRWLVTRAAVLPDENKVIGVAIDVTERREREEALQAALHARDVLMHEADHRIKNSLQMVTSLLRLQLGRVGNEQARTALNEAVARVDAVANAHLALQRSVDLSTVDVDRMVEDLCERVGSLNPAIALRFNATAGVSLDAEQAIPLGLIVSELLTNALRHAYAPGVAGDVAVTVRRQDGRLELVVADSGAGLPTEAPRVGLGSTVVRTLARQIGADVETASIPRGGTTVIISLPCDTPQAGAGLIDPVAGAAAAEKEPVPGI